jgi:glycosyltransferase involved in cell wall biosynthesis
MTISIVIPAFNAAKTIGLVLEALIRQEGSDFEVILVDDASTDDTSRIASAYSDRFDLKVLRPEENLGRARARNFGVRNSSGELVLLLDSDIETIPTYVATHVALHTKEHKAVGIGALRYPPHLAGKALARYYSSRGGAKLKPGEALPGKAFISCLASFRRSLFDEVSGFHEGFRIYGGEDLELGLRFQKSDTTMVYLPSAIGYHHHLRTIKEVVRTLEAYGEHGIPQVLKLHPDFAEEIGLEDLWVGKATIKTFLRSLVTNDIVGHPVLETASLFENGKLPALLISYLIYRSYRKGYSKYIRSTL